MKRNIVAAIKCYKIIIGGLSDMRSCGKNTYIVVHICGRSKSDLLFVVTAY